MSQLEIVADYGDQCGECPVWDDAASVLYWTDLTTRKFYCYERKTGRHGLVHAGFPVCGFALNRGGGFVVKNEEGVWVWDGGGQHKRILGEIAGRPCFLNDCTADPRGRLLTGTWYYRPDVAYEPG